jgi:two-component system C4-dicarboxylate transport sensor histidine kinase DctB
MTGLISLALIGITIGQQRGLIFVQSYWRNYPTALGDIIAYAVLLIIAAFIAWLFSQSISRALDRARQSEKALKEERDSLEIKVVERTAELRQAEAEKINQLYRLAEFGRLSSGIFHDLINPLTAVSLNLEQIKDQSENKISSAKSYLGQALIATRKMEDLIASIKRQLQRKSQRTEFSINEEIGQVIQILAYKARRAGVKIVWTASKDARLLGDAVKFSQIIINLLANSIEACEGITDEEITEEKNIDIKSEAKDENIIITVRDQGEGIAQENIDKIFAPFFSTKQTDNRGLGLGLASTKSIVEKDFGGQITVTSQLGLGAEFSVRLPKCFVSATANN